MAKGRTSEAERTIAALVASAKVVRKGAAAYCSSPLLKGSERKRIERRIATCSTIIEVLKGAKL